VPTCSVRFLETSSNFSVSGLLFGLTILFRRRTRNCAAKSKRLCQYLYLSGSIGKKVLGSQLSLLLYHSEARALRDFGLAAGQVVLMRQFIAVRVDVLWPCRMSLFWPESMLMEVVGQGSAAVSR
jgi:hypothetical protein